MLQALIPIISNASSPDPLKRFSSYQNLRFYCPVSNSLCVLVGSVVHGMNVYFSAGLHVLESGLATCTVSGQSIEHVKTC